MKKVLALSLVVAGLLFSTGAFSQLSYGVKGGINLFRMTFKTPDISTKMIPAICLGGYADYQIRDGFYIRPELRYSVKGSNMTTWGAKFHLSYLEIPVSFLYKHALPGGKVLVGIGPYIGFALGGNYKEGSNKEDVKFKKAPTSAEWASNWYFKPVDFGSKIYAGYELKNGFTFALESSLGMKNIHPDITVASAGPNPTGSGSGGTGTGTGTTTTVTGYKASLAGVTLKNAGFGFSVGYKIK